MLLSSGRLLDNTALWIRTRPPPLQFFLFDVLILKGALLRCVQLTHAPSSSFPWLNHVSVTTHTSVLDSSRYSKEIIIFWFNWLNIYCREFKFVGNVNFLLNHSPCYNWNEIIMIWSCFHLIYIQLCIPFYSVLMSKLFYKYHSLSVSNFCFFSRVSLIAGKSCQLYVYNCLFALLYPYTLLYLVD